MLDHISAICPFCKSYVTFSWTESGGSGGDLSTSLRAYFKNKNGMWVIGECPSCKNCVLIRGAEEDCDSVSQEIYPAPLPSHVDERIPKRIRADLIEAKLCFSVGAVNASVGMCRKALQRACKEKGATEERLQDQIDEIAVLGVISNDLKELAHSVRLIGNDGVHPNEEEVTKEEAEEILNLAEQFLDIIFVTPAKVKEIKERKGKN